MSEMRATQRNNYSGLLADVLLALDEYAQKPRGDASDPTRRSNPVLGGLADLVGLGAIGRTVDRMSYGEPLTTGKGMATQLRPDTKEALLAAPISPRTAVGMATMGMGSLDNAANKAAIVWHGSPHKFDRFDSSKIGTGEGAQAYGHGLYLAEARGVGADYADVLASPRNRVSDRRGVYIEPSPLGGGKYMLATKSEVGQPRGMAADATQFIYPDKEFSSLAAAMKFARQKGLLSRDERPRLTAIDEDRKYVPVRKAADVAEPEYTQFIASDPGHLYKVDLPDPLIARMLDWDKPLTEQTTAVQRALGIQQRNFAAEDALLAKAKLLGVSPTSLPEYAQLEALMDSAAKFRGETGATFYAGGDPSKRANELRAIGIPGIRYLDGGSRGAGAGTSNFVIFPGEENALRILERNGVPLGLLD